MVGACMGSVWAKWAWVITVVTCLGPVWVVCGLSGYGLELVIHAWGPYGFCVG